MIDFNKILDEAIEIVKTTGSFIRNEKQGFTNEKVISKGLHDFVSYVDLTAEKQLVAGFKQLLPEAGFIVEEGTETRKGDSFNWIIDPLDGTTNFIHGIYPFSISVALMHNDEIVLGIVYEIGFDECFYAIKGGNAYLNDKIISVTKTKEINDSLIATGFPYYDYNRIQPFMKSLEYFMKNSHGVRRFGSAATDLAYVACGRFDAYYEYSLSPWDVAAGAFIVQQAGGKVTDFSGGNNYIFGKEIVASNKNVFEEFYTAIKKYLVTENK